MITQKARNQDMRHQEFRMPEARTQTVYVHDADYAGFSKDEVLLEGLMRNFSSMHKGQFYTLPKWAME